MVGPGVDGGELRVQPGRGVRVGVAGLLRAHGEIVVVPRTQRKPSSRSSGHLHELLIR